jgi:hypothetical protein
MFMAPIDELAARVDAPVVDVEDVLCNAGRTLTTWRPRHC